MVAASQIDEKIAVSWEAETGRKKSDIAKNFNISKSTLSTIHIVAAIIIETKIPGHLFPDNYGFHMSLFIMEARVIWKQVTWN